MSMELAIAQDVQPPSPPSGPPSKPLLIIVGPSQAGKSTLVGLLTPDGSDRPKVGNGGGRSVTTEPKVFRTIADYDLLDCPGYDDSLLRFTDDACGKRVFEALVNFQNRQEDINRKCIFLVVNSLVSDSNRLATTLEWLQKSFGEASRKATVVLATKADRFDMNDDEDEKTNTLEELQGTVQELLGHNRYLLWRSKQGKTQLKPGDTKLDEQLQALREMLADVPAVGVDTLEELQAQIDRRAKQLCDEQIPINESFTVTHDRSREVLRTEVVGDHSASSAVVGAAAGGLTVGATSLAAASAAGVATAEAAVATVTSTWWFSFTFGQPAIIAPAVAMGPVGAAALVGAGFVGLLGYVAGRQMEVKQTRTELETWQEPEEIQKEIFLKAEQFYAQAKQEVLQEVRQSFATSDQ